MDLHYSPRSELTRPAVMLGVLKGLRRRGLRAFSVQPNIWLANNGHDVMAYSYLQVCTSSYTQLASLGTSRVAGSAARVCNPWCRTACWRLPAGPWLCSNASG